MPRLAATVALLALAATPAIADPAAGAACAANLGPAASTIYQAAAPDLHADTKLPDLLREKVRPMVISGKIDQSTARPAAQSAAACLMALRS